jgi:hypothetical protein
MMPFVSRALLVSCLALAAVALGGACDEHFPAIPAPDAGVAPVTALEAAPPAIVPPDLRVNASSAPVAFDTLRGGVWTANGDVGTVSYVDVDEGARRVVQEVPIGAGADVRSVAVSPDSAWVAAVDRAGGNVVLLDAETRAIRATIPVGANPRACVWDSANPRWLYVAVEGPGTVVVIDRTEGAVADTIDVGRIPAGLAVSATRREVYVTHRIDPELTIIDLSTRTVGAQVAVSDEPFTDVAIPNGKPLGFESAAVTADGSRVWLPHELLAPTHPFVFNETLFPAISVVDVVDRMEQRTDPNSPDIAGRKNLFDAINLLGDDGQPDVFSQLCSVAIHPGGTVAWALACGSEDLLTFDYNDGMATDVIRNLPCDHPAGMTLDHAVGDAGVDGARLFVYCDQSHTLLTVDTDGGFLTGHAQVYGGPIQTVAKDPVDPDLRAGETLFFRANSSKGPLPTTSIDWISCGGCHLDGFGPTNHRFFEVLQPSAPAQDARIGHVNLADDFSSSPTPASPAFNPHDILEALVEQGGLTTDAGTMDPSMPTAEAVTMAQQLARVVARDLPAGPTWQPPSRPPPDPSIDTAYCGTSSCHPTEYAEWQASVHAQAAADPMMLFCLGVETTPPQGAPQFSRLCAGCHDPVSMRLGDSSLTSGRGVTCLGCHDVTLEIRAGGNGDLGATTHTDWTGDHTARAQASLATLRQPEFCGGCHRQFVPGTGLLSISTLDEFEAYPSASVEVCVDCHMPQDSQGHYSHHFAGGNVYMGQRIGDATLLNRQQTNLENAATLAAVHVAGAVMVTVSTSIGHGFPTGVTDIREPWVEVQALDASGHLLATFGGPDATGLIPPTAARLGTDIADANGHLLYDHQISQAVRIPFDVRVPAHEAQALFVPVPDQMPQGTTEVDAVLNYRNVRTSYYRDAMKDPSATPPTTEMRRVAVPWP